jgi:hypothetical protein
MSKIDTFLQDLETRISNIEPFVVKAVLGDSTNNNRALSVNQIIKYFTAHDASKKQRKVGQQLREVYPITRKYLRELRLNSRTDAVDINEFLKEFKFVVSVLGLQKQVKKAL